MTIWHEAVRARAQLLDHREQPLVLVILKIVRVGIGSFTRLEPAVAHKDERSLIRVEAAPEFEQVRRIRLRRGWVLEVCIAAATRNAAMVFEIVQ